MVEAQNTTRYWSIHSTLFMMNGARHDTPRMLWRTSRLMIDTPWRMCRLVLDNVKRAPKYPRSRALALRAGSRRTYRGTHTVARRIPDTQDRLKLFPFMLWHTHSHTRKSTTCLMTLKRGALTRISTAQCPDLSINLSFKSVDRWRLICWLT